MQTIIQFSKIIDYQTWLVTGLAMAVVFVCRQIDFLVDLPTTLIGIAVVFPLVFSINSAYRRREDALQAFASLKAHGVALLFAHREWPTEADGHGERASDLLHRLLTAVSHHFARNGQEHRHTKQQIYAIFSDYSRSHEALRDVGVPANEVSRANQYLRQLIIDFEKMNNIARYRTPLALRAYSRLFLNLFPLLFGPYFAQIAYPDHPLAGYVVAVLYSLVLVSLDNIQDGLENPFDGMGADDLRLDVADEYRKLAFSEGDG
ncbi:bestrophin family ion channel [Candidatus Leptofilum sp.]|uniref:bestrophin family ion channel n=1 Tax=Candidatus Leptofilum sp. TaxID=3241576 RepID=UPI003B5B5E69